MLPRPDLIPASLALVLGLLAPTVTGSGRTGHPAAEVDAAALQAEITRRLPRLSAATVGVKTRGSDASGVLVSADGLVVTAAHVVSSAGRSARITLHDGRTLEATTLGVNHVRDGALLRIDQPRDLPPHVEFAPASSVTVGAWCIALGHPGGFDQERPAVPRLGRVLEWGGRFLRSDCAIVHGDSGGPLFDLEGRLLGVHSRIESDVDDNFHVPVGSYRLAWDRLLAGEEWQGLRGLLGVADISDGPKHEGGAVLGEIVAGSAAAAAGLRAGDVIARLSGEPIPGATALRWALADAPLDRELTIEYRRGGVEQAVALRLGEREGGEVRARIPERATGEEAAARQLERDAPEALRAFDSVTSQVTGSVLDVVVGGRSVAFATVVSADGLLVTKSSEVPKDPLIALPTGDVPARVVHRDPNHDLAILALDGIATRPVAWSDSTKVGTVVFAAGESGLATSIGVVGVAPRAIRGSRGRLGVVLEFRADLAVISKVNPDTPAMLAGLEVGDRILAVDQQEISSRADAVKVIRGLAAAESATLRIRRGKYEIDVTVLMAARHGGRGSGMDGARSSLREGFPAALQHDAVRLPDACGAPIVNLEGQVVGIDIARAGRVQTYALPARVVQEVIERWRSRAAR